MPDTQPTIPAEAIRAVAEQIASDDGGNYDSGSDYDRQGYDDAAEAYIRAALPHLAHVSPSVCCAATEQIYGHWLVEAHNHCTCGDGGPMGHEPGCGLVPLVDLATLPGWNATVAQVQRETREQVVAELRTKFGPTNRAADYLARAAEVVDPRG